MKFFYLINSRIPTEKAEGIEAMKLCEALCDFAELEFIASRRLNKIKEDPFVFYNIKHKFKITKLPVIDLIPFLSNRITFWLEAFSFSVSVCFYILAKTKKDDVIFSHDVFSLFFVSFFREKVFYDMHDFPKNNFWLYRILFKNTAGITTTNSWKKGELTKRFNLDESKICSYPNGIDLSEFDCGLSTSKAREKLNLPANKILVGYIGMLKTAGMAKGVDIAIQSLKHLSEDCILVLVGGSEADISYYKKIVKESSLEKRVIFVGFVKHSLIPMYLRAFNVLIAPFPRNDHYNYFMSPMKIFEYMASGRPIVATDLNSIREILNDESCIFVKPDDPGALADGIEVAIADVSAAELKAEAALQLVKKFTWKNRAEKIINFIK